jgi:hypothetical protein
MANPETAGRPQLTIINGTRQAVWVAMYKRSTLRPDQPPVAWQVLSLPPKRRVDVSFPEEYQVCARYSFAPEKPLRPVHQTNVLTVNNVPAGSGFVVDGVSSQDRRSWAAVMNRTAKSPGWYEISIANLFPILVWSHVWQEGRDVFPPRPLPPRSVVVEDLRSPFYLAVLPLPPAVGDLLPNGELAPTEIAVEPGKSVKIQGGLFVGHPGDPGRAGEGIQDLQDVRRRGRPVHGNRRRDAAEEETDAEIKDSEAVNTSGSGVRRFRPFYGAPWIFLLYFWFFQCFPDFWGKKNSRYSVWSENSSQKSYDPMFFGAKHFFSQN